MDRDLQQPFRLHLDELPSTLDTILCGGPRHAICAAIPAAQQEPPEEPGKGRQQVPLLLARAGTACSELCCPPKMRASSCNNPAGGHPLNGT